MGYTSRLKSTLRSTTGGNCPALLFSNAPTHPARRITTPSTQTGCPIGKAAIATVVTGVTKYRIKARPRFHQSTFDEVAVVRDTPAVHHRGIERPSVA